MKEFNELSKEDQKLICEAMKLHSEAMQNIIDGIHIDNSEEFRSKLETMSSDAREHMIEFLKGYLPKEYKL